MKPKAPRPYHHGDLRQALVEASVAILKEEGATALTLRSAARRVGVSHAAPKNHFGDLRGLLAAVATHGFHGLAQALEAAKRGREPRAGLVAAAEAYVRFAVGSPGAFRAMFHPALAERSLDPALEEASRAAFAALVSGIEAAQVAGVVSAGDAGGKSLTAWSFVHGLASLAVDAQLAGKGIVIAPEVLAALGAGYLFDGLANVTSKPGERSSDGRLARARGGRSSGPTEAANETSKPGERRSDGRLTRARGGRSSGPTEAANETSKPGERSSDGRLTRARGGRSSGPTDAANETSKPGERSSDGRLARARRGRSSGPTEAANVTKPKAKRAMTMPRAGKSPAKPRATRKRGSA